MAKLGNVVNTLRSQGKINPPAWVGENLQYLTIMGSVAYGVSTDNSDLDLYGFTVPPKTLVFPHLAGEIYGFGRQIERFDQYQHHHLLLDQGGPRHDKDVDLTIYSIVKYFQLCMECNPNMIDSLFTPSRCVLVSRKSANHMRDNKNLFLSKKAWHSFKGYAFAQLAKATAKTEGLHAFWAQCDKLGVPRTTTVNDIQEWVLDPGNNVTLGDEMRKLHKLARKAPSGKRVANIVKHGWDVKFGYHVVRLVLEIEQILTEGTLELDRKSSREHMKAVRAGDFSLDEVKKWFHDKEASLGKMYESSELRYKPDEAAIKVVLLQCLEEQFGSLEAVVGGTDANSAAIRDIRGILARLK